MSLLFCTLGGKAETGTTVYKHSHAKNKSQLFLFRLNVLLNEVAIRQNNHHWEFFFNYPTIELIIEKPKKTT